MTPKGEPGEFNAKLEASVAATVRHLKTQRFDLSVVAVAPQTWMRTARASAGGRQLWLLLVIVAAIAIALAADLALAR